MTVRWQWMVLVTVLAPSTLSAASLEVAYASLERLILEKGLTEGGRRYFQGGAEDTCNYAFVQNPRVSASGGRLEIRFLFAGSIGKQVAGRCVGSGDNFDIVVSGVPSYAQGEFFLDEMEIDGESRAFSLFSGLLGRVMGPMMRVPVQQELTTGFGRVVIRDAQVSEIVVGESSLTVTADVDLAIHQTGGSR